MRVMRLKRESNSPYAPLPNPFWQHDTNEQTHIDKQRQENDVMLTFFIADCECGQQALWRVEELAEAGKIKWDEPASTVVGVQNEVLKITCPSCGAYTDLGVLSSSEYDASARCLETWQRRTPTRGLAPPQDREEPVPDVRRLVEETSVGMSKDRSADSHTIYAGVRVDWSLLTTLTSSQGFDFVARELANQVTKEIRTRMKGVIL